MNVSPYFAGSYKRGELVLNSSAHGLIHFDATSNVTVACVGIVCVELDAQARPQIASALAVKRAYQASGEALSNQLIGQYAAVVVDHARNRLLLIQDSFGLRTIFFSVDSGNQAIVFSTRLSDIVGKRTHQLNLKYFANILNSGDFLSDETPFHNVDRLSGGSTVIWDRNSVRTILPWSPRDARHSKSEAREALDEAARTALTSALAPIRTMQGKVWCDVSGGLDSTTVFLASKLAGIQAEPFSVVSPDSWDFGDTDVIFSLVAKSSERWHRVNIGDFLPFSKLPDVLSDEPGGEIGFALRKSIHEMRLANNVAIALSGLGGDQVFGSEDYMPTHISDYLASGRWRTAYRCCANWSKRHSPRRSMLFWLWHYGVNPLARHLRRRRIYQSTTSEIKPVWIRPDFVNRFGDETRRFAFAGRIHPMPGRNSLWQEVYMVSAIEALGRSHAYSCDYYYPLLHRPLVELMCTIDFEERRQPDQDRVLHRRAFAGTLPQIVRERTGKGTGQIGFDRAFAGAGHLRKVLKERSVLSELGIIDFDEWRVALNKACFGIYDSLPHFNATLSVELWLQSYFAET